MKRTDEAARTARTRVRREPERARYDRATIDEIIDAEPFCHVGFVHDGWPHVIPTLHARIEDRLYLHGSSASRLYRTLAAGTPACVTITSIDGLVLARSAFNQSVNYRSVVVLGRATPADNENERLRALKAFSERLFPGRWSEIRQPSAKELKATAVVSLPLDEVSAKVRVGPPEDDPGDIARPIWAGVIPLGRTVGDPEPDPHVAPGTPVSEDVLAVAEAWRPRPVPGT